MIKPGFPQRQGWQSWLATDAEDQILRWLFRAVVAVTLAVLGADLAGLSGLTQQRPSDEAAAEPAARLPDLVPALLAPWLPGNNRRVSPVPQPDGALGKPMTFELVGGGKLMASGTLTPGIATAFAAEIAKRGDYVKTVVLNSPGGSVADAIAMGRLIREKKLSTEVETGKYCASSCPLVFFGGVERRALPKAAIGVHQVFSPDSEEKSRDAMADAQRISARCQRYLTEMGISLDVWVHAMETPTNGLFIFNPDELKALNIVTAETNPAATTASAPRRS